MTPLKFGLIVLCALCAVQLTNAFEETTTTNRWCTFSDGWAMTGAVLCVSNSQYAVDKFACCSVCVQTASCRGFWYQEIEKRCFCAKSWSGWLQQSNVDAGTMPAP